MLSPKAPHVVLQMHGYFGFPGLIGKYKPGAAIYRPFHLGRGAILQEVFQSHICHGNGGNTALAFGTADKKGLVRCPGELVNTASVSVKVKNSV